MTPKKEETAFLQEKESGRTTYRMWWDKKEIRGTVTDLEALKQAISKGVMTEQGVYDIYGEKYGLKKDDLIGQEGEIIEREWKRRIRECIEAVDGVTQVGEIESKREKDSILFSCNVETIYGQTEVSGVIENV